MEIHIRVFHPANKPLKQGELFILRLLLQQTGGLTQNSLRTAVIQDPSGDLVPLNNQGHPTVNLFHGSIRSCGKDHEMVAVLIPP